MDNAPAAVEPVREAPEPRPERPARSERNSDRPRREERKPQVAHENSAPKKDNDESGSSPGFGDDVPAFFKF
jgi:hypothetical protein